MKRKLAPLLIVVALSTPAGAAEFPKSGEAELVTYAAIQDFPDG